MFKTQASSPQKGWFLVEFEANLAPARTLPNSPEVGTVLLLPPGIGLGPTSLSISQEQNIPCLLSLGLSCLAVLQETLQFIQR